MPYRPRRERTQDRVRRAGARAQSEGSAALSQALAQIGAAFDEAAAINDFKIGVERFLRLGPHHAAVKARFAARGARLGGCDLEAATARVERWRREERKAYQIASALGVGTRLSLDVLDELCLVLRLMRFKHMAAQFQQALEAICPQALSEAAE